MKKILAISLFSFISLSSISVSANNSPTLYQSISPLNCYFDSVISGPVTTQSLNPDECNKIEDLTFITAETQTEEELTTENGNTAQPSDSALNIPDRAFMTSDDKDGVVRNNFEVLAVVASIAFFATIFRYGWLRLPFRRRN